MLTSCSKKFLDQEPNNKLPFEEAITDVPSMQTALNGAYAQIRATSLFGRDFPILGDLMGGNIFIEYPRNSGRYLTQFRYQVASSDAVPDGGWKNAYGGILDANQIIDSKVTGAGVDAIKAQAYAIRALLYFKLVNIYARPYTDNPQSLGVPLILHYDPYQLPKRNTVQEVYTQIISDLKTALQSAPDYERSITLSKYAIEGLLARAYFYMGDYANAKAAAVDVIDNSGFKLLNTPDAYRAFWSNANVQTDQTEVMFEIDVTAINNNGPDDLGGFYYQGYQDVYASKQLVDLYSPTDIRTAVLRAGATKGGVPATLVLKYPNGASATDRDNLKVIRLAEIYLIAAESSLPGDETDARKYLNELMAYRDPSFTGYVSTGAQLLQDIVTERRKELAFEGDRLYDLNRLKWDLDRGPVNPGSVPTSVQVVPYTDYRRISPIGLSEIQANANIKDQQNPGYAN
jgi:tetratricopeptide (TPR) repeat protein